MYMGHRAELVAIQASLRHCARSEAVKYPHGQPGIDRRHSELACRSRRICAWQSSRSDAKHCGLARCPSRNNLRLTTAKVSVHTGIDGNERADEAAQPAATPDALTAHSQPRGYTGRVTT